VKNRSTLCNDKEIIQRLDIKLLYSIVEICLFNNPFSDIHSAKSVFTVDTLDSLLLNSNANQVEKGVFAPCASYN